MNTAETIRQKVFQLPPQAQEELLKAAEEIERRYQGADKKHPAHTLNLIAKMAVDVGVSDLAQRHNFYAHGKLED